MISINKIVANSIVITTGPVVKETTVVKYTAASGLPDWEGDIVGELTSSSIPNKVNITEVEIGSHVTSIGNYAFSDCSGLTSVTIPAGVTRIGSSAFNGCSSLTSMTIPDSVTRIWGSTFYGCRGFTSVTIPDSVTIIGNYAFEYCTGLTSLTIPDSVTSIGDYAFGFCSGLMSVTFSGKDKETVQAMDYYSWELPSGCTIHCTNGDITI